VDGLFARLDVVSIVKMDSRRLVLTIAGSFEDALEQAQRSESSGFDALYQQLAGPVTAFAMTRGANDPEGITNDVFLQVFRNIGSFSGDESDFRSWVFAIARNRLIDAHRSSERRPKPTRWTHADDRVVSSAERKALARLGNDRVADLLGRLTVEQREVIALRIVADLPLAEVATIVGKPISAVKRLQARGLRRLQKEILDEEVS